MKKLIYLLPFVLLVFACGNQEPAGEDAAASIQSVDSLQTPEAGISLQEDSLETAENPETVTARHILICYDGCAVDDTFDRTKEEALEQIQELRDRINSGEIGFEQAAIQYSDCPSSSQGGMLGEFGRGAMVPEFEEAAFALPVGGMSDVVETVYGYHLIYREN